MPNDKERIEKLEERVDMLEKKSGDSKKSSRINIEDLPEVKRLDKILEAADKLVEKNKKRGR